MKNRKLEKLEKETVLSRLITYICAVSFFMFFVPYIINLCCNGIMQFESSVQVPEGRTVEVETDAGLQQLAIEEYIVGVMGSCISADSDMQLLKAMAVILRSNALQTKYVQELPDKDLYMNAVELKKMWGNDYEENYRRMSQAVEETARTVLVYGDDIIYAPFFAVSAGSTREGTVLGTYDFPYLISIPCPDDVLSPQYLTEVSFSKDRIGKSVTIDNIDSAGYVLEMTVDGVCWTGEAFRRKYNLASAHFSITENKNKYKITVKGAGHGFGLSVYGANSMALHGNDFNRILMHYYSNVRLDKK